MNLSRAPDKRDNTATKRGMIDVVLLALQCSQRIGQWLVLLSAVHILCTLIAVIWNPALSEPLEGILKDCCQDYYRWGITLYFGKAAVENVLKIAKSAQQSSGYLHGTDDEDESIG